MSEEKKEVDVRDLKPSKDAKGGRRHRREGGSSHGGEGNAFGTTAGRGRHQQQ